MNSHLNKTLAREYAFKLFYDLDLPENGNLKKELRELSFNDAKMAEKIQEFDELFALKDIEHPGNSLSLEIQTFGKSLVTHVLASEDHFIENIENHLSKRSWQNVDRVDKSILLIALSEHQSGETPPKVLINEAVNLAKKYGTKDASKFVNAILDKLIK